MSSSLTHCFAIDPISRGLILTTMCPDQQADRGEDRSNSGTVHHFGGQADAGDATGEAGEATGGSARSRTGATHAT